MTAIAHPLADRGDDVYETPEIAVEALLKVKNLPRGIWEPAYGPSAHRAVLRRHGHVVMRCASSASMSAMCQKRTLGDPCPDLWRELDVRPWEAQMISTILNQKQYSNMNGTATYKK